MEIFGPLVISTIAGLSTVIGGLVLFFNVKNNKINEFIVFCLSFSLSVMICISITDLIPLPSKIIVDNFGIKLGLVLLILVFLLGMFLVNIVNKSIELTNKNASNLYKVGILSMIALMLHNFPEGIATFMASYQNISLGISLAIAIMMHNIPEGISIAVPIYYSTNSKKTAIKHTFISGLAEPLGAILAYIFLSRIINDILIAFILIFVSGIMITLAINKMLPEALYYKKDKQLIYGLIVGAIIMIINQFFI